MHWLGLLKGGPGSGNFGHAGRPGQVGGSAPDDTPSAVAEIPSADEVESSRDLVTLGKYDDWRDSSGKRKVTLFHYSREDRTSTGLKREFAGSAGAGEEKRSFEYDKEGKLNVETVPVHAYMYGAKKESMVPGNVLHKIEAELNVLDVGSKKYREILSKAREEAERTGRPMLAMARALAREEGYDALSSEQDGIVQILRDVRPEELSVVGPKKKGSSSVKYKMEPDRDSDLVKDISRRWDVKLHNAAKSSPEYELYALQNIAAQMINMGALSKEDRHAVIGNLVGSDFPDEESVYKKAEELKSKIKEGTSDSDRDAIDFMFKHGITVGKSKEQLRESLMEQVNDIVKENDKVAVRVPADIVERIIKEGRFKSQFETGSSSGLLNPEVRKDFEKQAMGVPDDVGVEDRPIYGYMSSSSGGFENKSLEYYGGISFVLKDDVKDRVTVTFGDSLDGGLPASKIDDIKLESVHPVEPGWITSDSFSYVEAQIHGQVSTGDIEEAIISNKIMRAVLKGYKRREGDAGDFSGFKVLELLYGEGYKVSVEGPVDKKTGRSTKISVDEWADSDLFKDFIGTEEGDAFLAHVEVKYGKKSGSSDRPSWW